MKWQESQVNVLEAAEEPPQDHTSDQEDTEDGESLSEVNWRADQLEFIRELIPEDNEQSNWAIA